MSTSKGAFYIPLLKNIRAEDIEDVTERYIPMFTEERNADTVKRMKISENHTFYFVSLIEHKTKVDYNVSMQMLRYMVYIWEDYLQNLSENSTDELLGIIALVTASMLRHLDVPENEVTAFTEQVKEKKMAELFENFVNDIDMSSLYKIALERSKWKAMKEGEARGREVGLAEGEAKGRKAGLAEGEAKGREVGLAEGEAKGREAGLAEGEKHFAKLTRRLLEAGRLEDLAKAADDPAYRNQLYLEFHTNHS